MVPSRAAKKILVTGESYFYIFARSRDMPTQPISQRRGHGEQRAVVGACADPGQCV